MLYILFPAAIITVVLKHTLLLLLILFASFVDAIFLLVVMLHILKSKRLPPDPGLGVSDEHFLATSDQFSSDHINPEVQTELNTVRKAQDSSSSAP